MKEQQIKTILISPDGSEIKALYDESLDLTSIGSATMTRVSNVVWDEDKQMWEVILNKDFFPVNGRVFFKRRSDAINWEVAYLNKMM